MISNLCEQCYYNDKCNYHEECEDYTSIDFDEKTECIEAFIEERRDEYREAWNTYITEYDD